jgi:hypothetical protein
MKVYIGKPARWVGPYQIADLLQYVGFSEDKCHELGTKLSKTWLNSFCEWFHGRFRAQRKTIKIHPYDVWNVDGTLAVIILPLLKELQKVQNGSPHTDDADVPENLRSTACEPLSPAEKNSGCTDNNHHARWAWVLSEMIWAFEQLNDPNHDDKFWEGRKGLADVDNWEMGLTRLKCDYDGLKAHEERIQRGTTLFGKYYQGLWD